MLRFAIKMINILKYFIKNVGLIKTLEVGNRTLSFVLSIGIRTPNDTLSVKTKT